MEATYDEAWRATREALLARADTEPVEAVGRYEAGIIEATVMRPILGDELHFRAEIKPIGGAGRTKRNVCVWVQELDAPVVQGVVGQQSEKVQAQRRRDLEREVTRHIEQTLGVSEDAEESPSEETP